KIAIAGGSEAWQLAPELAAAQVPVFVDVLSNLPASFDQIDSALIRMAGGFGIFHFNKDATLKGKASDSDYMALMRK
ncbi:hypothetical protein ABGA94_11075, partial [Stenotrophomonas sp. 3diitr2024]